MQVVTEEETPEVDVPNLAVISVQFERCTSGLVNERPLGGATPMGYSPKRRKATQSKSNLLVAEIDESQKATVGLLTE
jgi:hypothetical protein